IRRVINDDELVGVGAPSMGSILWWYLSSVTHSASYALMQSVQPTGEVDVVAPGQKMAAIYTSSWSVMFIGLLAARAYVTAVQEHASLMGWDSERWVVAQATLTDLADAHFARPDGS